MARSREIRDLTRELKEKCEFIAQTLRFKTLASEEELSDYYPGGSENSDTDLRGWIFCYANYTRFCERLGEDRTAERERESEDVVIKALSDAPEKATLSDGTTVDVYPKSFAALQFIQQQELRIQWLLKRRPLLLEGGNADDLEFVERIDEELLLAYQTIAFLVTVKGPALPLEMPTSFPEWIQNFSTADYVVVHRAFVTVNVVRLHILNAMLDALSQTDGGQRPGWSTFFSTRAEETHKSTAHLMNDVSLISQVGAALLAANARKRAEEDAKQKQVA